MFWAIFKYRKCTKLIAMKGDLIFVRRRVPVPRYIEILEEFFLIILNNNSLFM
jgi:hypothetical protein